MNKNLVHQILIEKISAGTIPDCDELEMMVIKNRALEIEVGAVADEAKTQRAIALMNVQLVAASQKSLQEVEELFKEKHTAAMAQYYDC